MKKTFLNIFYNAVYQVFLVLVPLITVPYLSRVLGPTTYGIYSSVNNTVQFLMIFCVLSLSNIGVRSISKARAKSKSGELTDAFWGLWYFQFIGGLVTIALTVLTCLALKVRYWNYFLLMLPYLIAAQFDISWFFQGLADFGRVVLRNTIVKIVSVVFILLLIKSPADLWKYFLIMSVSTMLGSFVFWFSIGKYVGRPVKHFYHFAETRRAIMTLMIPQIATQIYTSLDKPLLGLFQNTAQVSYYDNSQRISNMILGVITSISLVIMPQMAVQGKETQNKVLKKSLEATTMLGTMFAVVVMANTKEFVPFFFGKKYIPMTPLMFFFTLTIILIPMGGVFANQFALANKRDKDYAIPVTIGAVLELVFSYFLDRPFGAAGAMVAILLTEAVVLFLRCWIVRDGYDFKETFSDVPKCFLAMGISLAAGMLWPWQIPSAFINMTVKSLVIMALYLAILWLLKFDLNEDLVTIVKKRLKK
ncbi:oligosaccharide flippase family protein [Lactobacillus delbrueckii]|uniref:oligosaccharide flippase family protein n=1 Tax=Lactobacillus delbrueckii TaxID=1584 RepID=UPI0021A6D989|nr:oligosaccharide flippase family protein [Lactobacillus delbrueckii]MCT2878103.1 flippase [Lactobacillus delbrueckii]MCT3492589.1 flippase [Lactobacillus delbrueckii]